jgi:hypothetical protein
MNTNFIYTFAGQGDAAARRSSGTAVDPLVVVPDHGDRACYCPAKAAVHAVVHELPGVPGDTAAWIYDDHDRSLTPAVC